MSCELSYGYRNPCRWEKLTTWWPACDPMDCNLPGSSVHGIFQARVLEWAATSFSGYLPNPGIESGSPALQTGAWLSEPPGKPVATTSCHNSENWLRRNGNKLPLELKAALKTIKMTLIRALMANFRMTIRADCEVSAWAPSPILKSSARWLVGVESAFGQKLPSRLQALEIKRTLLSTNCLVSFGASSSWAHFSEQILAPRWGCALAMSGWGREYQMELPPWWCPWEAGRDRSSWLAGPEGGFGGRSQQLPKPFIWVILPVSPLLGTECQPPLFLGQTGKRLWTRWRAPRSSKSTGVHPANFSWGRSAIWAFLPVGSDVCLQLRTLYEHRVSLRVFAGGVWRVSDIERHFRWELLVWDSISSGGLWQFCLLICECVFYLCD